MENDAQRQSHILELKDVSKRFFFTQALDHINLTVNKGIILGLLGPNGSGKSTLLKTICGLVHPDTGFVLVDGLKPSVKSKAKISYLPEIDHIYSWMTIAEALKFVSAFYRDWQEDSVPALLETMGLDQKSKVGNLSKGMRARLKLILSLARDVPLVLLDEPLSGIDPPSRQRIISSIVSHYRTGEQTIIISTHEVNESEAVFDDVVFLKQGFVKLYDSAENLRSKYGCSIQDLWEKVYE